MESLEVTSLKLGAGTTTVGAGEGSGLKISASVGGRVRGGKGIGGGILSDRL